MNTTEHIEPKPQKKKKIRWLRRLLRVLVSILIFFVLLVFFVRSPWGQDIIVNKVVTYVSDKTKTKITIQKLFITFDGDLQLDGLYLEDKKGDTLVYSKSLEANLPLWKMINGEAIGVDALDWEGLRANIIRKDSLSGYNFQFLIDAFVSTDSTTVATHTTSKPLNLIIGDLKFNTIDIRFDDAVLGIDSRFKIGELKVDLETTDLDNMIFDASNIDLSNSQISFVQKHIAKNTTSSDVPLPNFSSETINLKNVTAYYESQPDQIIADLNFQDFYAEIPQINLEENDFHLDKIRLKNSKILVNTETKNTGIAQNLETAKEEDKTVNQAFEWPQLKLTIAEIDLENNQIDYRVGNAKPVKGVFDPEAVALQNLSLKAEDLILKNQQAHLHLNEFSFNDISGLNLKQLALNFEVTDSKMRLENLKIQLNNNSISGFATLDYKSINQFLEQPENTKVAFNFPRFSLSLKNLFKFQPELQKNSYLDSLSKKQIRGSINAWGTLASINLPNANITWGKLTQISANGTLQHITDPETLQFDIPKFSVETQRLDVIQFVDEEKLGISLPEAIQLTGQFNGNLEAISAEAKLNTTQGIASIAGNFKNTDTITYNLQFRIEAYKLNELLKNEQFGALSLNIASEGSGTTINDLNATLDASVSEFQLNNYEINDLKITGDIKNGTGNIASKYKDKNLNIKLGAFVVLDSIAPEITIELNIIGAHLQGLGLVERNVKTGMKIFADFKGNGSVYDVSANVDDGVVIYDKKTYMLGNLDGVAHVTTDTTFVSLSNKMVDINLRSNTNPQNFSKALKRHVLSYFFKDNNVADSIQNPVNLKLDARLSQSPLLNDVFLVNVKDLDTIDISVDFNEKVRQLKANITAPHINYSGNELDSLAFSMTTDKENFKFNLGFKNLTAGPLDVPKTVIRGNQTNNELSIDFLGYHDDEQLLNVNTKITSSSERLAFTVNPNNLLLNKRQWLIPATNEIVFTGKNIAFNDFKISRDNQSIEITDKLPHIEKSHIAVDFKNFKISEIFSYLNPEAQLATGQLNGNFILEEPLDKTGLLADLNIENLTVLKTDLGTFSLNGKSLDNNNSYAFYAGLKGGDINFDLIGDYIATAKAADLNLDLNINEFKMKAMNTLSLGEVKNAEGSFNGKFKVTGTTADPIYNGSINFNNASFNVAKLNTTFTMQNETLNVNNTGLSMSNFTILDANKNALVLSGDIGTKSFVNPSFNLNIKANNFQILKATKEDNETLYGQASFNVDAKLTGDLQIPKLNADLTIGSNTNVTYVMPSSYASIEERDGVVVFVNRENPDAILTQTEEQTATIKGFDISTRINIGKDAAVTVVLDEETGDNFRASGEGDFIFTMVPNGRISLTGSYEISDGHYELNLYNLVNRKFLLAPGSRVTWSGDPFDAELDVRAIYNVQTSASALMASQISGADPSVRNKYRQVLPFNVYLNIDGELLAPKISFGLDMPEEEQGAIGGQVYGRVQQVNGQKGELNRQVFSLLVLNRFYPDSGSDGSSGGFALLARDNLNDAVSEQLNAFSDKLLGHSGIELDFGLNSFTDYQGESAVNRTQLDVAAQKKLFDDRLIVRVGSEVDIEGSSSTGEATPLIGNVSLEYIISEDGRYRLKGFRKSAFENVIDGQTIVSGIALIFTQEFNKFDELWDAILRFRDEKKAKLEADKKAAEEQQETTEEATDKSIEKKEN